MTTLARFGSSLQDYWMGVQQLQLDPLLIRRLRFLIRVVRQIPQLLTALESGHVEASMKLGRRRLKDGRQVELWLLAKAPKRDETPLVRGRE